MNRLRSCDGIGKPSSSASRSAASRSRKAASRSEFMPPAISTISTSFESTSDIRCRSIQPGRKLTANRKTIPQLECPFLAPKLR